MAAGQARFVQHCAWDDVGMFRHVLLLTMRDDADDAQVDALVDALRSLPAQIPEIASYRAGRDLGLRDDTADVAIVGEYADEAAWRAYLAHPAHRAVVTDHVEPLVAHRQSVQFND